MRFLRISIEWGRDNPDDDPDLTSTNPEASTERAYTEPDERAEMDARRPIGFRHEEPA